MALDSEAKRWAMLQVANGPGYSHVINPSGSNFDSTVERLTLLNIYGANVSVDVTAPVLSSPTGVKTGATTADGSVSTDEANGTLYHWVTTNATETAANIKLNGDSQAVSTTGVQNVSVTGLTPDTVYYAHFVHDDAASNESNVVTSAAFATDALAVTSSPTGGFWVEYEKYRRRLEEERERLEKLKEKTEKVESEIDSEIAKLVQKDEAKEVRLNQLKALTKLAEEHRKDIEESREQRVIFAANKAIQEQTFSAMEAFERKLRRMKKEEEDFMEMASKLLFDQ